MAISGRTQVLGVFGFPVSHSRSPLMHNRAIALLGLDWTYVPFLVDPSDIKYAVGAIRALKMIGVNVTVPLKELIAPHLDAIDPVAAKIKSVNTIVHKDGVLTGYSTDGPGLMWDLADKDALPPAGGSVLVLGAGGSARAVVWAMSHAGYHVAIANRTKGRADQIVSDFGPIASVVDWGGEQFFGIAKDADLIVNTTSLGMGQDDDCGPPVFAPGTFSKTRVLYDLVYSPPITALMREAAEAGCRTFNGLGMLARQGALSLGLWTGLERDALPIAAMEAVLTSP